MNALLNIISNALSILKGVFSKDRNVGKYIEHKNEVADSQLVDPDDFDSGLGMSKSERKAAEKRAKRRD